MEVVTGALPSLIRKLAIVIGGEFKLQAGLKGEVLFLLAELETMKAALEKVSETPADKLEEQDKTWAREARELSYDMEDSMDMFMLGFKGSELAEPFKKFIDRSLSLLMQPKIRRKITAETRNSSFVMKRERRPRYEVNLGAEYEPGTIGPCIVSQAIIMERELVGIDEARDELIKIMTEGDDEVSLQQVRIVSIVGIGGLGKTTLANAVYEKLRAQFDCCAFVTVSQTPDFRKLFRVLFMDVGDNTITIDQILDDRRLINGLREFLGEKRYLIVVDDLWDISVWRTIKSVLPDNNCGYRIITTTRIFDVATQVGGAYRMKPLSLRNSRILLNSRIFRSGNSNNGECSSEVLAEMSDRILKICAGVPLAIIAIAGVLARKGRNKIEWYGVYNSVVTGLEDNLDVKNVGNILSFSYYDLPAHLKACLLYLSVFPEDFKVEKDHLIWLWIAEGFIQHNERQWESMFELGESYFYELINRSMIQPVYDQISRRVLHCRVHDMVLDLILSLCSEENFVTIWNETSQPCPQTIRRLSLQTGRVHYGTIWTATGMQRVRSVVVVFPLAGHLLPSIESFRVLRVLDLQLCDLSQKSESLKYLGQLFRHLRYLGLRDTRIYQLPEEVGNLVLLQTLDIRNTSIDSLPGTIVQLKHLMRLRIDGRVRLPDGIRGLTSLQELSWVSGNSDIIIDELGHLTELRILHIILEKWDDKLLDCIPKLQKIQNLYISVERGPHNIGDLDSCWDTPWQLRSLDLRDCYCFSTLPDWMYYPSFLQNLSMLRIVVYELWQEDLETLGRLPALTELYLEVAENNLGTFESFVVGAGSFPCLVRCKLWRSVRPVVFLEGAMPRLTLLRFPFSVRLAREIGFDNGGLDVGLENLPSLEQVMVALHTRRSEGVEEAEAALRQAAQVHPNHPTFETEIGWDEPWSDVEDEDDESWSCDEQVSE